MHHDLQRMDNENLFNALVMKLKNSITNASEAEVYFKRVRNNKKTTTIKQAHCVSPITKQGLLRDIACVLLYGQL